MRNALKGNLALMAVSAALIAGEAKAANTVIVYDRKETTKETTTTYTPVQAQQTVSVQQTVPVQSYTPSYQPVQQQVVYQPAQQTIIVKEPAPQTIIVEKQVPQTVYVQEVRTTPHWTEFLRPNIYIGGWYHRPYCHGHWHGHGPRPMYHYRHHHPHCR